MSFNWNNVIKSQAQGMDLFSAYYKEEQRFRRENAEKYRKKVEERQKQQERYDNEEDENNKS